MSKEKPPVLLDTCIWLDNYDASRPFSDESRRFIDYCLEEDIPLLYSATSIKDVYYLMLAAFKADHRSEGRALDEDATAACRRSAYSCIKNMQEYATAIPLDTSDIWLASKLESTHPDFEDNLIIAAAKRSGARVLVTNDMQLIAHAPCTALTPGDALESLRNGIL